uniref:GST C-terminal domain-containing protein n=1 Tax=Clastoptera arizonana TaxID=38151 RepID=A0A1B6E1Z4_9HEMI
MNRQMELDIWQGDWGLPTIDLDCLQVLAYIKFAGVTVQVKKTNNPFLTPTGSLPVFRHNKHTLTSYDQVTKYLTQKNFCPDFGLNTRQLSEIFAYTKFLRDNLYPALQLIWWVDERNYVGLSRKWYAKALPFPLNFYYPNKYKTFAEDMMDSLYPYIENAEMIHKEIYKKAERCLNTMSIRLGESEFLFGPHPTSLDAILYAYLAPLLKAPFPNSILQNHLRSYSNLYKYVIRISQRYFPNESLEYEKKMKENTKDSTKSSNNEVDFPHQIRNKIFAVAFAVSAMAAYAITSGLVQFNV